MLKKQIKRREKEVLIGCSIMIGIYLFVLLIVLGVGIYQKQTTYTTIVASGSLFALIIGIFLKFFIESFYFLREFNIAISMGQTRKQFVWYYELVSLLEMFLMVGFVRGLWAIEEGIYYFVIPRVKFLVQTDMIFNWKRNILIIFGMVAIQMLMQALLLRYGMKIYWGIWIIWMLLCYTPSILSTHSDSVIAGKFIAFIKWFIHIATEFGESFWIGIGMIASGILVGIAWLFLRKQQVTM